MKQIPLGRSGKFLIVDDDFIIPEKGSIVLSTSGYPVHKTCLGQKTASGRSYCYSHDYIHHLIMGKQPKGFEVDHINGNRLDNRRSNLRICTRQENARNMGKSKGRYKGVHYQKKNENNLSKKVWIAQISVAGKCYHIGSFQDENEAALAYNKKAQELHGEFARLNKIEY